MTHYNVSGSPNNRDVFGGIYTVPVQIYDFYVHVLEKKISNFRRTGTIVRQHQGSSNVENDTGRVFEKHLQVSTCVIWVGRGVHLRPLLLKTQLACWNNIRPAGKTQILLFIQLRLNCIFIQIIK